jgi:hypothetical protein
MLETLCSAQKRIGTEAELQAPIAQKSDTCTSMLADAIANETPLTQVDQCAGYEQVDDEAVWALVCMAMPAKKMTLAQECQMCMASGMSITCTAEGLFGEIRPCSNGRRLYDDVAICHRRPRRSFSIVLGIATVFAMSLPKAPYTCEEK